MAEREVLKRDGGRPGPMTRIIGAPGIEVEGPSWDSTGPGVAQWSMLSQQSQTEFLTMTGLWSDGLRSVGPPPGPLPRGRRRHSHRSEWNSPTAKPGGVA